VNGKRLTVLGGLLVMLAAALWWSFRPGNDAAALHISGNIELTEVDLSFKLPGRIEELLAEEGATVEAGQLLARLDTDELDRQRAREEAGVSAARSALDQIRAAIAWQEQTLEGDLALRRAELAAAESRHQELLNGSRPQEIEAAQAVLAEAAAHERQARMDWGRAQKLYAGDDISTAQYDQFRARAESAAAASRRASGQLALVREGPRREQIEQQRAAVDRARAALRLSEAGRLDLERRRKEALMREAEIRRAIAQLGLLDVQLSERVLRAPAAGLVLSRSAEPGEVLAGGATVLTLGLIRKPWLRGYIGERDLGRVRPGMTAEVTTGSYPGKTYAGRVSFIASEAEFTPKQIQTADERQKLVYRIKNELGNPNQELKLNMPADAVIRLE
jgi:HlyD family secretion protein